SPGDIPGQYTFVSNVGKSVVDLIWSNLEACRLVRELRVSDSIITSDHFPVILVLDLECEAASSVSQPGGRIVRFKWDQDKSKEFQQKVNTSALPTNKELVYKTLKKKKKTAAVETGMTQEIITGRSNNKKPWYNKECRKLKTKCRQFYRKWKRKRKNEDLNMYLDTKKQFFRLCLNLKNKHEKEIKEKLTNIRSSQDFWKTIKKYKAKKENKSKEIPMEAWNEYLVKKFPERVQCSLNTTFSDVLREQMDADFCLGELEKGLKNMKNNKSPGPDNVLNEYLKTLSDDWKRQLLSYVNYLFNGGDVSETFAHSFLFMLHKKGEVLNCDNYRSIALLNNVFKLVTHMISQRVLCWSENNGLFMEGQAGFRPGRGCIDTIFSLSSIVSLHLIKQRKLYAAFVDFKAAFSEVRHDLLFLKMFDFGVSAKVISLLRNLYQNAEARVRVDTDLTSARKITKGVLEGDSISPISFIIFINDLETYLRDKGADGVSINSSNNILLLLYCDDLIILGDSKADMQRKLNYLYSYCNENKMTVNEEKSKIVVFRRGGKLPKSDVFYYNDRPLEVCSDYVYLGIKFSSHGVFHKASQQAVSKGRMAVSAVRNILVNSKMESHESRMKLYYSIVTATLLYGSEI
ncbi:hypothetical protein WDU94_015528, partial [Cyamophila willieti]